MFDDLISRQAAIEALEKDIRMAKSEDGELWVAKINAQMKLTILPSIEPKYAYVIVDEDGNTECSNCGSSNCFDSYCGNCGAKLIGTRKDGGENG